MEEKVFLFTQASLTEAFRLWAIDERNGLCCTDEESNQLSIDALAADRANNLLTYLQK